MIMVMRIYSTGVCHAAADGDRDVRGDGCAASRGRGIPGIGVAKQPVIRIHVSSKGARLTAGAPITLASLVTGVQRSLTCPLLSTPDGGIGGQNSHADRCNRIQYVRAGQFGRGLLLGS